MAEELPRMVGSANEQQDDRLQFDLKNVHTLDFSRSVGSRSMSGRYAMPLIALSLAGCGMSHSSTAPSERNPVAGHHWGLRALGRNAVKQGKAEVATIRFRPDGGINGTISCNSVSTSLVWSFDRALGIGRISDDHGQPQIQTVVGCGDSRETAIAGSFWEKMNTVDHWSLDGRRLHINFSDGGTAEMVRIATPASERRPGCVAADPNNFDCRAPR